jgi:hypothetical protein
MAQNSIDKDTSACHAQLALEQQQALHLEGRTCQPYRTKQYPPPPPGYLTHSPHKRWNTAKFTVAASTPQGLVLRTESAYRTQEMMLYVQATPAECAASKDQKSFKEQPSLYITPGMSYKADREQRQSCDNNATRQLRGCRL